MIGIPSDEWGEEVIAIVMLHEGQLANESTETDIIAFCKEKIAGYKCPRQVKFMDELPTSGAGKILKNVLREPYWEGKDKRVN